MATVPQSQSESSVWGGLGTSTNIPERLRKYTNLGQLAFVTRGPARFLWMINNRFPQRKTVESREHKTVQIDEHARTIPVTVGSVATDNHTTFGVPDNMAPYFHPNDIFWVRGLYIAVDTVPLFAGQVTGANTLPANPGPWPRLDNSTGFNPTAVNWSTTYGEDPATAGRWFTDLEQILVMNVGNPGSAGAGSTQITVARAFRGPHARDWGGARIPLSIVNANINPNGAITTNMILVEGLSSFPEGTGPTEGYHKSAEVDQNFTQEFKYAIDWTLESSIEDHALSESRESIARRLMILQKGLHIERTFLLSQKGKQTDSRGRVQYTMGGALEWIPRDRDHIFNYPGVTITYPGILDLGPRIFDLGGSEERHAFCSPWLHAQFKKAFYNSGYMRYDPEASNRFDIRVDALETQGGVIYLHPTFTMSELGMQNQMFLVDMSKPTFQPVTHKGWDMMVIKTEKEQGQMTKKEQWVGILGLERRYREWLQMITFNI